MSNLLHTLNKVGESMDIVILRHGEAGMNAASDELRPLTQHGVADTRYAGEVLQSLGFNFEQVWVSPYLRTQQTADQVLASFPDVDRLNQRCLIPEGDPRLVLAKLSQSGLATVLLISHQPLVSRLVALLTDSPNGSSMAPASMAFVSCDINLMSCGQLHWLRHGPLFNRD